MRKIIVALLFASSIVLAPAALLLSETFDYTNGPLVSVSSGKWIHTSGSVTGEVMVVAGSLVSLSSTNTEDVFANLAGQPYPAGGATNVFYASFTLRFGSLPTSSGAYFAHFDGSGFRARVWALTGGAATGKFRLGLSSTSSAINITNTADLSTNTDYLVVLRLTNSTGAAKLWINPASEPDPGIATTETASGSTVTSFAMRQNTGEGSLTLDNLLVGTSFFDVVTNSAPVAPTINLQPASQSVIAGGTVTFAVNATGLPAPAYQWQFASTNLPGATNASLTLTAVHAGQAGNYQAIVTNIAGSLSSGIATLTVNVPATNSTFSVVHYNVMGNFAPDWSTNAAQVQAIARQLQHLDPDIILLNEIPSGQQSNMTNWMTAFFPTYTLAISPGTDGVLRSGVISRFLITRSQSWLENASLTNFGYNGTFTRDLLEAEIAVPGMEQPLHVFTTHLKSGTSASADAQRRAAEASTISNFFATTFLPTNGSRPYLLTGDLNEDIAQPAVGSQQPIQKLVNTTTGLRLTTPVNPFNGSHLTHSIRHTNGPANRYDYILPCGLLYSNFAGAQIFRADLLTNPPAPLLTNDSYTASDHLPVFMKFGNPYIAAAGPFSLTSIQATGSTVTLNWESVSNKVYGVEASTNLFAWTTLASNLTATGTTTAFITNSIPSQCYFRVFRLP